MMILDSTSGSTSNVYTYSGTGYEAKAIAFSNDGSGDATLVINEHTITVKPGEVFDASFPIAFTTVDITISGNYRMLVGR